MADHEQPPVAPIETYTQTAKFSNGNTYSWDDDYFYMKDKDDERTIPYIEAENEYCKRRLEHLEGHREELYNELLARVVEDDKSPEVKKGDHYYYNRTETGKAYRIYCRRPLDSDEEQILLDCNQEAEGKEFFSLGCFKLSPDYSCVCYAVDATGGERYELRFKNLDTLEDFGPVIENARSSVCFDNMGNVYFGRYNDAWRLQWLYKQSYTDDTPEVLVMDEPDEKFRVGYGRSQSGEFIFIIPESAITSELYFVRTDQEMEPQLVIPRKEEVEFSVEHWRDWFYIMTNEDATNFKVVRMLIDDFSQVEEVLAHDDDVTLSCLTPFANFMAIEERSNGMDQIRVMNMEDNSTYYLEFEEESFQAYVRGADNPEFDTEVMRITYQSAITPPSDFDYNMRTKEMVLIKQKPVNNYVKENYEVKREFARAHDGELIPMTMVYRKDVEHSPDTKCFLDGYGSYGYSNDFCFDSNYFSLVDRGVTVVFAHIRGGGEFGRRWKLNGKLMKKQNTFLDFVSCTQHLIFKRFTSPANLVIEGASAGGLLMGAVLNMRPDLYAGALMRVPFVDVLTTISDASLPLTAGEWDEWGNPITSEDAFEYMQQYSPYDNVRNQKYPPILLQSSINDTRVLFHEPVKYCAKLRKVANADVLLDIKMAGGHGGKSGRYEKLKLRAQSFSWMLDILKLV